MKRLNLTSWMKRWKITTLSPTSAEVPSLVETLTGDKLRGSWWSHEKAHEIYNTYQELVDRTDVLTLKLVETKVTFVHQDLWKPLLSSVLDEQWQESVRVGLAQLSLDLLTQVENEGMLICTRDNLPSYGTRQQFRKARSDLERRGLLVSGDVHTATGAHAPILESWRHVKQRCIPTAHLLIDRVDALEELRQHTGNVSLTIAYSPPNTRTLAAKESS